MGNEYQMLIHATELRQQRTAEAERARLARLASEGSGGHRRGWRRALASVLLAKAKLQNKLLKVTSACSREMGW